MSSRLGSLVTNFIMLAGLALPLAGHAQVRVTNLLNAAGTLTAGDPTYNRVLSGSNATTCSLSGVGTAAHYQTYNLNVTGSGPVQLRVAVNALGAGVGTLADSFVSIYSGSFIPGTPCVNLIAADDDSGQGFDSEATAYGVSTGTYVAVVSTFGNGATGTYQIVADTVVPIAIPALGPVGLLALIAGLMAAGLLAIGRRASNRSTTA